MKVKTLNPAELPEIVGYPGANKNWNHLPLGVATDSNGNIYEEYLDVLKNSSTLISGNPGSGKTILQQNILLHCVQHADIWDVLVIDTKYNMRQEQTNFGVSHDLQSAVIALNDINDLLYDRYEDMMQADISSFRDLKGAKAMMVLIDESYALLDFEEEITEEDIANNELRKESLRLVKNIIRIGRSAGAFICLTTQLPEGQALEESLELMLTCKIIVGPTLGDQSSDFLGHDAGNNIPHIHGRSYIQRIGEVGSEFQGYFASRRWLEKYNENDIGWLDAWARTCMDIDGE